MQRNGIFPRRYAPLTYYDWLRGASRNTLMARNAEKYAISLHTCISIKDKANFNEQNKSIAVGPFYIHVGTDFEPIWTHLPEDLAVLNPTGYYNDITVGNTEKKKGSFPRQGTFMYKASELLVK